MAVYVDDMQAPFGRMSMCHMVADSDEDRLSMANRIGVARCWHQYPGTAKSHFDICLSKRHLTVRAGAIEISRRQLAQRVRDRRNPKEVRDAGM